MAKGCRDCSRCTESSFDGCMFMPIRLILWLCGGFILNFFRRRCPECGHMMGLHRRIGGRFAD